MITKQPKYGVQITDTEDGSWSVSQLIKKVGAKTFTNPSGRTIFIDYSRPGAADRLVKKIEEGLKGKINVTKLI